MLYLVRSIARRGARGLPLVLWGMGCAPLPAAPDSSLPPSRAPAAQAAAGPSSARPVADVRHYASQNEAATPHLTVDLPPGPYVVGEAIAGACAARDERGVPRHASIHWALEHQVEASAGLRRRSTPCEAATLHVTDAGIVADRAGTFVLLCELLDDDGEVLARSEGHRIEVRPAPAVGWRVELHDQGPCFDQASRLPMTWEAWDAFGNPVRDLDVQLVTEPATDVRRDQSGGFLLMEEGSFSLVFRAQRADGSWLPEQRRDVVIDSTPPTIELLQPYRGEMVESSDANVLLVGRVTDRGHGIAALEIEGVPQPLPPAVDGQRPLQHEFRLPYRSRWGLNVVHGKVTDACGNTRSLLQSFLRSDSFASLHVDAAQTPVRVHDRLPVAATATLYEPLWKRQDERVRHDLRHLIELAAGNGGLDERLPALLATWPKTHVDPDGTAEREEPDGGLPPAPVRDDFGFDVWRDGPLRMSRPVVESLDVSDEQFFVRLSLADIELPFRIQPVIFRAWPTLRATLLAEQLTIETTARVHMGAGGPVIEIGDHCVKSTFAKGSPKIVLRAQTGEIRHGLSARMFEWLMGHATRGLRAGLEQRVRTDVAQELGRILSGLKLEHALDVPAPMGGGLRIRSGLENVRLGHDAGGAACGIDLYSATETAINRARPRGMRPGPELLTHGPIRAPRAAAAVVPERGAEQTFSVAVKDDLFNQLIWSIWAGGALNSSDLKGAQEAARADTDDQGRNLLEAAQIQFYFLTPPVVMPSARADEVRIGVGDVYAEIEIDLFKMNGLATPTNYKKLAAKGFFSIGIRAKLGVDERARALQIVKLERSHAQVHVVESPSPIALMAVTHWLEKMVRLTMPHHLAQAMAVSVPLPTVQVGLLPGMPNEVNWAMEDVSLLRPPHAQETILRGRFGSLPE
jgi:hypothetical protein